MMDRTGAKAHRPHMADRPLVCVVDDDESIRESLPDLVRELGFEARAFSSAEEFLESGSITATHFLILDVAMPGMSGPDLHRELMQRRQAVPTIFITAHRDDYLRLRILEQGAIRVLFKPFSDTALAEALDACTRAA